MRREIGGRHRLVVEPDRFPPVDRNGLDLTGFHRRIRGAARGNDQVHTVLEQRRCDHENDQEHERQVEQRRDVDLGHSREVVPLGVTPHRRTSISRTEWSTYLCSNSEASSAAKLSISTMIPRMLVTKKL